MIDKPQKNKNRLGIFPGCCLAVVIIGIIVGAVIVANPAIIPPTDPELTTLAIKAQFTYTYPDRYTFEKNTTELLTIPYAEYGAIHYTFNLTIEGHWWNPTTYIHPRVASRTSIILQFYHVNPGASNSFIDVAGALTVYRNATVIIFDVLRLVTHSDILDDPNDYWRCEMTFEALEYITL